MSSYYDRLHVAKLIETLDYFLVAGTTAQSFPRRTEGGIMGSSMVSTMLIPTADKPGFQDLKFYQYVTVWKGE